ncbi:MAG: hypothetical protein FWG31_09945 [Oscillospiraceae bacterium]|nr:hypothetical protein [Oscillospiraceae bacterium]
MTPYEVYIAYISWGTDGKRRPVLFLEEDGSHIRAFRITSQYESKSDTIKEKYIKIADWKQSGLLKPSYIDAGEKVRIEAALISPEEPIGKLTDSDKRRLLDFLAK